MARDTTPALTTQHWPALTTSDSRQDARGDTSRLEVRHLLPLQQAAAEVSCESRVISDNVRMSRWLG